MKNSSPCVNCGADTKVCKECDWYNGVWISKDQYEAKVKTEMIAMLKELKQEIEKLDTYNIERTHGLIEDGYVTTDVIDIIQQKINVIKEDTDDISRNRKV